MRSPTLLLIRMNAADTNASNAIAAWTLLTVVSRSSTTDEIETFIKDVSTTSTNIAAASSSGSRGFGVGASGAAAGALSDTIDPSSNAVGSGPAGHPEPLVDSRPGRSPVGEHPTPDHRSGER